MKCEQNNVLCPEQKKDNKSKKKKKMSQNNIKL